MLRLTVLGDSIAYGTGAARPGDALGPRLVAALSAAGLSADLRVVAAPGARSADLVRQVDRCAAPPPEVAVVVVGANDLTHLVPVEQAAADLQAAVRRLRGLGAEVVLAPAPDLSAVPHVPPALRPLVQSGSRLLRQAQVRAVLAEGGRTGDTDGATSAAFADDPRLFAADRFHPSSAGYAVIAGALAPAVLAAARAVAASS